eukprot:634744-Prorocentrum_minimum.AAC.4
MVGPGWWKWAWTSFALCWTPRATRSGNLPGKLRAVGVPDKHGCGRAVPDGPDMAEKLAF